jgi:hypothetical protein
MAEQTINIAQEVLSRADTIGAWLSGKIGAVTDFATQQAIDIATQYILYGRIISTIAVCSGLLLLLLNIPVLRWYSKLTEEKKEFNGFFHCTLLCGSFTATGFLLITANFSECILVWAAPKLWLITQLKNLV